MLDPKKMHETFEHKMARRIVEFESSRNGVEVTAFILVIIVAIIVIYLRVFGPKASKNFRKKYKSSLD